MGCLPWGFWEKFDCAITVSCCIVLYCTFVRIIPPGLFVARLIVIMLHIQRGYGKGKTEFRSWTQTAPYLWASYGAALYILLLVFPATWSASQGLWSWYVLCCVFLGLSYSWLTDLFVSFRVTSLALETPCQWRNPEEYGSICHTNQLGWCYIKRYTQIAKFMGQTWGPPGSCRPQMVPMLAPWILLSGVS